MHSLLVEQILNNAILQVIKDSMTSNQINETLWGSIKARFSGTLDAYKDIEDFIQNAKIESEKFYYSVTDKPKETSDDIASVLEDLQDEVLSQGAQYISPKDIKFLVPATDHWTEFSDPPQIRTLAAHLKILPKKDMLKNVTDAKNKKEDPKSAKAAYLTIHRWSPMSKTWVPDKVSLFADYYKHGWISVFELAELNRAITKKDKLISDKVEWVTAADELLLSEYPSLKNIVSAYVMQGAPSDIKAREINQYKRVLGIQTSKNSSGSSSSDTEKNKNSEGEKSYDSLFDRDVPSDKKTKTKGDGEYAALFSGESGSSKSGGALATLGSEEQYTSKRGVVYDLKVAKSLAIRFPKSLKIPDIKILRLTKKPGVILKGSDIIIYDLISKKEIKIFTKKEFLNFVEGPIQDAEIISDEPEVQALGPASSSKKDTKKKPEDKGEKVSSKEKRTTAKSAGSASEKTKTDTSKKETSTGPKIDESLYTIDNGLRYSKKVYGKLQQYFKGDLSHANSRILTLFQDIKGGEPKIDRNETTKEVTVSDAKTGKKIETFSDGNAFLTFLNVDRKNWGK